MFTAASREPAVRQVRAPVTAAGNIRRDCHTVLYSTSIQLRLDIISALYLSLIHI